MLKYGRDGSYICPDLKTQSFNIVPRYSQKISSVYFDNTSTFSSYDKRIQRKEGATLIRMRWYGNVPKGDEILFIERKTHHEPWVSSKSIKERFAIRAYAATDFIKAKRLWTDEKILSELRFANKKAKSEEFEKQVQLCRDVQQTIISCELVPCIRSSYNRVAFQHSSSNDVRLTLDSNLVLNNEASVKLSEKDFCHPHGTKFNSRSVHQFPYGILEIKLKNETPSFIDELINSDMLIDASKFSKFQSGVALFYRHKIQRVPYWYFANDIVEEIDTKVTLETDSPMSMMGNDEFKTAPTKNKADVAISIVRSSETGGSDGDPCKAGVRSRFSSKYLQKKEKTPARVPAPKQRAKVEPKTYFANERTFIQWLSISLLLITFAIAIFTLNDDNDEDGRRSRSVQDRQNSGLVLVVSGGFIAVYSICMYLWRLKRIHEQNSDGYTAIFGPIILTASLVVCVCITVVYNWPTTESSNVDASFFNYFWQVATLSFSGNGPEIRSGICEKHSLLGDTYSSLHFQPSGISFQRHWPAGNDNLLIVSNGKILQTSASGGSVPKVVEMVGDMFDKSSEAVFVCGNKAFVIVEDSHGEYVDANGTWHSFRFTENSYIIELILFNLETKLFEGRWDLSNLDGNAEGIAYIPTVHNVNNAVCDSIVNTTAPSLEGSFIISSFDHVYEFPVPKANAPSSFKSNLNQLKPERLQYVHILNQRLLNSGLRNKKIGDLLFEYGNALNGGNGLLHVLHDNEGLIRSWRLSDSTQVGESILPGVTTQWEGMTLNEHTLYLTQDTPAEIWSFTVTRTLSGGFVFPSCANPSSIRITE